MIFNTITRIKKINSPVRFFLYTLKSAEGHGISSLEVS